MPTFNTPAPISVSVDIGAGSTEIIASDRTDTVVEIRPSNSANKNDVAAAEQTQVSFSDANLTVKSPRNWRRYVVWNDGGSVDVKIELPSGSRLRGEAGVGELRVIGPTRAAHVRVDGFLGECTFKVGAGDIQLSQAGPLQLRTGAGDITVERAVGHSEMTTGSGAVQVSQAEGSAVIKNSNGDIWVGEASGDLPRHDGERQDPCLAGTFGRRGQDRQRQRPDRRGHGGCRARPDGGGQSRSGGPSRRGGVAGPRDLLGQSNQRLGCIWRPPTGPAIGGSSGADEFWRHPRVPGQWTRVCGEPRYDRDSQPWLTPGPRSR